MRGTGFMRGSNHILLNRIGVPYGYILVEGFQPSLVVAVDQAENVLAVLRADDIITDADIASVLDDVARHNLKPTFDEVLQSCPDTEKNDAWGWDFVACHEGCGNSQPHGNFRNTEIDEATDCFDDLIDAILIIGVEAGERNWSGTQALAMFNSARSAGLLAGFDA